MPAANFQSPNFDFLRAYDPQLLEYAARAERYVLDDPNTALIKLRQFAEDLAEDAAACNGIPMEPREDFTGLLHHLARRDVITREMADIFHGIRKAGNAAAHEGTGSRQEAVNQFRLAHRLAVWFHRAYHDPAFKPRPFALPPVPEGLPPDLKDDLDRLRKERWDAEREADESEAALKKALRDQAAAEARAATVYEELHAALAMAEETEARRAAAAKHHADTIARLRAEAESVGEAGRAARRRQAQAAAARFDLTESEARRQIDAQLRARGWEADSVVRTWEHGARPQAGRNMAIAFYPTDAGHADYVLFRGVAVAGIIEAKRRNLNLRAGLDEAAEHSRAYRVMAEEVLGAMDGDYRVPLLFASNGRPFAAHDDLLHGIWFRDARRAPEADRVLEEWPAPGELDAL